MRDSGLQLPVPIPLPVPWMVSPSTPFLRLVATEPTAQGDTYVEFAAYYLCDDDPTDSETELLVVQPPGPFQLSDRSQRGVYRLVRIVFESGAWARMSPAHSDTQVVNESEYDWSQVSEDWSPDQDVLESVDRDRERWRQTGVCPDPRVYEIASSNWLRETGALEDGRWHHFLIMGHDCYAEVIALGFKIVEGQVLR